MKSPHCSSLLKGALLIVLLALCLGGSTVAQAGGKDPLSPGPIRPGNLDYRTELPQGYLKVYSATDEFNDGDGLYFPHSFLKTSGTNVSRPMKFPRLWRCPLELMPS